MNIFREQIRFICPPRSHLVQLIHDPQAAFAGFKQVLTIAILWEGVILLWALGGTVVTIPAFLKMPVK